MEWLTENENQSNQKLDNNIYGIRRMCCREMQKYRGSLIGEETFTLQISTDEWTVDALICFTLFLYGFNKAQLDTTITSIINVSLQT